MSKVTKVAASIDLAVGLVAGGAAAANATTVSAGGGTWDYGVSYWTLVVWSNYYHSTSAHYSTACSSSACTRSATEPGGVWSNASRTASWGGNTAYWSK